MENVLSKKIAATLLVMAIAFLGIVHYSQAQKTVVVKKTTVVRTLPKSHVAVSHRNVHYRYVDGVFYKPHGRGFVIVDAPVGIRVAALPKSASVVRVRGKRYYRVNNIYYRKIGRKYEVVTIA